MSAVHGNLPVGDLNPFQMYHEGTLQMNSMVTSGRRLDLQSIIVAL